MTNSPNPSSAPEVPQQHASGQPDEVLAAEQHYLTYAREQLARMRNAASSLDAGSASDAISAEVLGQTLARRVAALQDDPRTTLFFGRIDWHDPSAQSAEPRDPERLYIGRRHVSNEAGDALVIDWRAPVSTAFYRASPAEPMGVQLRRRFGVEHGQLTAYEDETFQPTSANPAATSTSATSSAAASTSTILAEEIERPRSGPMRDIVSTIQPEQDALVRADVGASVCIQGAPGTGKTAVGLHRAAWLLYSFRAKLDRAGVLIVGPNAAFLDHISAVLPSLGEARVRHATIDTLLDAWPVRAQDEPAVAVCKGDARWADVITRAVWSHLSDATDALVVPRGSRKWRIPAYEVNEILADLRSRDVRYEAARAMLAQRLAHAVLVKMEAAGDSPDDRVQDAVARSSAVKKYVKAVWPILDAATVLFKLFSDQEFLLECADGVFSPDELAAIGWSKPPRTKAGARWTRADLPLLDEAAGAIEWVVSLGHLIVDEAQDLSAMQLRALGRRCSTGSVTVLGDIAQATTPWAPGSWAATMTHLGKPDFMLTELLTGFRVPAAVIEYAAGLLPQIAPGLQPPVSVRSNPGELNHHLTSADDLLTTTVELIRETATRVGSVGVIADARTVSFLADALASTDVRFGCLGESSGDAEDHAIELVPAQIAKGLEFDHVIVVGPHDIVAAEPDEQTGLRRLYVVLTRAVSRLDIVRTQPVPQLG